MAIGAAFGVLVVLTGAFGGEITPQDFISTNPHRTDNGDEGIQIGDGLTPETRAADLEDDDTPIEFWPSNNIFYTYEKGSFSRREKKIIKKKMDILEKFTCIKFRKKPKNSTEEYLNIVKGNSCWSYIGRNTSLQQQNISINRNCFRTRNILMLLFFALGFPLEHTRYDRNEYVIIYPENIQPGLKYLLRRKTAKSSASYDYFSLMQLNKNAYSLHGNTTTIAAIDPMKTHLFDSRKWGELKGPLSHGDIEKIAKAYKCYEEKCANKPQCLNRGVRKSNCNCLCPRGTSGQRCNKVTGSYYDQQYDHSSIISINKSKTFVIEASNQSHYLQPFLEIWYFVAPNGTRMILTVDEMFVCNGGTLSLSIGDDLHLTSLRGYENEFENRTYCSATNGTMVTYECPYGHISRQPVGSNAFGIKINISLAADDHGYQCN